MQMQDHATAFLRRRIRQMPPDAAWTFLIKASAAGIGFSSLIVLARLLPADAYGLYALMMSCLSICVVPAAAGFDRLLVREVAALMVSGKYALLNGLRRRSLQIVLAASASVALGLMTVSYLLDERIGAATATALLLAIPLVPLLALVRIQQATLQGLGNLIAGQVPEALVQPTAMMILAIVTLGLLDAPGSAGLALTLQLVAVIAALTCAAFLLRRRLPRDLRSAQVDYRTAEWMKAGFAFMWLIGMSAILTNMDTILVGALRSPADAGVYRVASQLAMLVGMPLTAVSISMAPAISALYATGQREELQRRARQGAVTIMIGAAGIGLAVAVLTPWILKAFGPPFAAAHAPASILAAAYLVHSSMATGSYLLFMTAHERTATLIFAIGIVIHALGAMLLVPPYGLLGAAIASGASLCFVSMTCAFLARRLIGINATVFASGSKRAEV